MRHPLYISVDWSCISQNKKRLFPRSKFRILSWLLTIITTTQSTAHKAGIWQILKRFCTYSGSQDILDVASSVCIALFFLPTDFIKNIARHTAPAIVSWPNPKQWKIVQTFDLMMIIRQRINIISIITRGMGELKTRSPINCIMDNREKMLILIYTLDKIYLTGILKVQCLQISLHNGDNEMV